MELTLRYLYHLIRKVEPDARIVDERTQPLKVQWVALPTGDTLARRGFLYFLNGHVELSDAKTYQFGCVVRAPDEQLHPGIPRIVVSGECDMEALFDQVITDVDRYRTWEESLNEILVGEADLQDVLNVTYELVDRPMYIADPCWRMIARVDADMDEMSGIWHHQLRNGGYLPIETIDALNETGEYELITNSNHAFNVKTKAFVIGFIAKTIKYRGKLLGYLFVVDLWHDLTPCEVEIAERCGNMLAAALGPRGSETKLSDAYYSDAIEALLGSDAIEPSTISSLVATTMHWRVEGDFRLVTILHPPSERDNPMLRMKAVGVLTYGYDCYSSPVGTMTLIIFRRAELDGQDFQRHLQSSARQLGQRVFESARFTSLLELPLHYRQILALVEQAPETSLLAAPAVIGYDEAFPFHLANACSGALPVGFEAQVLMEHDRAHGTDYARSLYLYLLHERNAAATAQAMYLHRNTLHARIQKVLEMLELDLDNPNTRLRLAVSLNVELNASRL